MSEPKLGVSGGLAYTSDATVTQTKRPTATPNSLHHVPPPNTLCHLMTPANPLTRPCASLPSNRHNFYPSGTGCIAHALDSGFQSATNPM